MKKRILTQEEKSFLLVELSKRQKTLKAIRDSLFPEQIAFIDDASKLKTAQCTRRAGKSYSAGAYLCLEAIRVPRNTILYIATTREQAKRIMYKDVLKEINKSFSLGIKFNHTSLEVAFPNGSVAYLLGSDSKPEEIEKALGQKYGLVIIDESGSHKQDQRHMIHEILEPACADRLGTICLMGSPVTQTRSYFFDITYYPPDHTKFVKGWRRHKWGWENNPHVRKNMQTQINRLIDANPRVQETAPFKRMYLNQWIIDPGNLVYKYDFDRNFTETLPTDHNYYFNLSLDLGFNDDTAFVISACSETDPNMYFVEAFKQPKMDITDVANKLSEFRARYLPVKYVVDGASKQAVEELKKRHGFPLEVADKVGKADVIEIMNADFIMGRIKVLPGAGLLAEEWANLIWDDKSTKREEHPGCPNHGADAALYGWRKCYHYAAKSKEALVDPNSDEGLEKWWDRQAVMSKKKSSQDFAIRDWGKEYGYN